MGNNTATVVCAALLALAFVIPWCVVESHTTARACLTTNHTPEQCARWGKP